MIRLPGVIVAVALLNLAVVAPTVGGVRTLVRGAGGGVVMEEEPVSGGGRVQLRALQAEVQLVDSATPFSILLGGTWGLRTRDVGLGEFTTEAGYLDGALGFDLARVSRSYLRVGAGASALLRARTTVHPHGTPSGDQIRSHTGLLLMAALGSEVLDGFGLDLCVRHRRFHEDQVHGDYVDIYSLGGTEVMLGVAFRVAGN